MQNYVSPTLPPLAGSRNDLRETANPVWGIRGRVAQRAKHPTWPLLGGNRNSLAGSRKPAVIRIHASSPPSTASALEIGNHIAGYTDYYAIRV